MDLHRFDADPDADSTVHLDADPNPDPALVGKSENFYDFYPPFCSLHCLFFLVSVYSYQNFQYFLDSTYIAIFWP